MTKRTLTPTHELPPALARGAERASAAAKAQHAKEAQAEIDLVLSRSEEIAGAFWDVGRSLARLSDKRLFSAMDCASFEELCEQKLSMSATTARRLIAIATQLPRESAVRLRQERSAALIALAAARGVPPSELLDGKVRTPGAHQPVDLSALSANKLKRLARDERHAHAKGKGEHARKVREAETLAVHIAEGLKDVASARVRATATRSASAEAVIHVEIPVSGLAALVRAVRSALRAKV